MKKSTFEKYVRLFTLGGSESNARKAGMEQAHFFSIHVITSTV